MRIDEIKCLNMNPKSDKKCEKYGDIVFLFEIIMKEGQIFSFDKQILLKNKMSKSKN